MYQIKIFTFSISIVFQVFCQMIKANINIRLSDLINILQVAIKEFKINQKKLTADLSVDERKSIEVLR